MKEKIFFVEDDVNIYEIIKATLSLAGYEITGFYEPLEMLQKIKEVQPDLIILDLMLPNLSGYEVIKKLQDNKKYSSIPIIIVSAKSSEIDIVKGLDLGASDYITKPFGLLEFSSRVKANLKKRIISERDYNILEIRDLSLNSAEHKCTLKGVPVELTVKEFEVVKLLMRNPSTVVTRSKMLNVIWGYEHLAETRTLDMHIRSIREKFSRITNETYVETVRGIGYIINE